jgi:Arc/MetJ-type ribon-helix-helix transcriptional regulator
VETIQVVLGKALLRATDRAAKKRQVNRSALVREALRAHLAHLATVEREERDRAGYEDRPEEAGEFSVWDTVAAWPDEQNVARSAFTSFPPQTKRGLFSS